MSAKLARIAPEWHAEAVRLLKENGEAIHTAFLDATRRAAWYGLFLNYVKARGKQDKSIPHGQFRPWLEQHLPDLSFSQAAVYMTIGRGLAEKSKLQISDNRTFATVVNAGQIPEQVEKLIAGKTQNALFLEYKQAEEPDADGILKPKRGRLKGQGGNSKEALASAADQAEASRINDLELGLEKIIADVDQNCDLNGYYKVFERNPKLFAQARATFTHAAAWINKVHNSRAKS